MKHLSESDFASSLPETLRTVVESNEPTLIRRGDGRDIVVVSAAEWKRETETRYVHENESLRTQIEKSLKTMRKGTGYRPDPSDWDAGNTV